MGYAMIDGNIHWASDVVAGVLIGHAIGWTVGTDFRSRYGGRNATQGKERPSFIPVIANGSYGFQMRVPYWQGYASDPYYASGTAKPRTEAQRFRLRHTRI